LAEADIAGGLEPGGGLTAQRIEVFLWQGVL